ncbi:hypothetical protein [Lacipirellula sp.]|uniref:hypothetical protein n=1 Tax=Lacipirellula sp. TaxID=2691419 RepID=UPI003D0C1E21
MSPEEQQALDVRHRENVIAFLKARDIRVIQGAPITEEMIQENWREVLTPWNIKNGKIVPTPVSKFRPLENHTVDDFEEGYQDDLVIAPGTMEAVEEELGRR